MPPDNKIQLRFADHAGAIKNRHFHVDRGFPNSGKPPLPRMAVTWRPDHGSGRSPSADSGDVSGNTKLGPVTPVLLPAPRHPD